MEAKTVQANAFRTLVEALKEVLNDANLEFDKTGLKIMAMDTSHTVLVYLKLDSEKFESEKFIILTSNGAFCISTLADGLRYS